MIPGAHTFIGMPRGFIDTLMLLAFLFLVPPVHAGALATPAQVGVATLHAPKPDATRAREGQHFSASVMFAEFGVTSAGGVRGSAAGNSLVPTSEDHAAQGACKRAAMAVSAATRQERARS